jgi:hypothetical protein
MEESFFGTVAEGCFVVGVERGIVMDKRRLWWSGSLLRGWN